jgi:hypothetical protein
MDAQEWLARVSSEAREHGAVLAFGDDVIPMDDDFFQAAYGDLAAALGCEVKSLTKHQKQVALMNHIAEVQVGDHSIAYKPASWDGVLRRPLINYTAGSPFADNTGYGRISIDGTLYFSGQFLTEDVAQFRAREQRQSPPPPIPSRAWTCRACGNVNDWEQRACGAGEWHGCGGPRNERPDEDEKPRRVENNFDLTITTRYVSKYEEQLRKAGKAATEALAWSVLESPQKHTGFPLVIWEGIKDGVIVFCEGIGGVMISLFDWMAGR